MRLQNDQDGATIWEFALVLPLLILFTLGLMDFSRYLTARAILNSSANRAVSLAAVVEDLDTDCRFLPDGDQSACGSRRESAITSVLTTARQMPLRTMIGDKAANSSMYFVGGDDTVPAVELMLGASDIRAYYKKGDTADPKYSFDAELPNGPSLTAELRERPIEVTLRAEVRPYLWFLGPLQVSGFASGFRERRSAPSFPKRIDCVNDAVAAGEEGTTVCPCKDYPDDGSKVESEEGVCSCREGLIYVEQPDGSFTCECPGDNFLMPDNSGRCTNCQFATAEEASCGENQIFDPNNCACIDCPNQEMANEEGTSCSCPANFITENECTGEKQIVDLLNCKCFNCPGATVANDQHTTCVCQADCDPNAGEYLNASQCRCESCAPPKVVKNNNCVCDVECAENEVIDYVNCRCTPCPPRTTKVGNSCVCEAWGTCNEQTEILNLSECRCDACPPDHVPVWGLWCVCNKQCPEGQRLDQQSCSCVSCPDGFIGEGTRCICNRQCPGNQLLNSSTCSCYSCPNGKEIVNGSCRCTNTCAAGQIRNDANCACTDCPPNTRPEGNSCVCDLTPDSCGSNSILKSNCRCQTCPDPKVAVGNRCACPGNLACHGGALNVNSCLCICPPDKPVLYDGAWCGPPECAEQSCIKTDDGLFRPE